jgi:hypothetical protein
MAVKIFLMSILKRIRPSELTKRPRLELLIWTVCAVLILLGVSALILLVARVIRLNSVPSSIAFPNNEDLSTLGTLYQGIVGAAVALAGSLVAIRIAQLGLGSLQQQERRESADFVNNIIEKGIPPLITVIVKLSELHHAFKIYQGALMASTYEPDSNFFIPPFSATDDAPNVPSDAQLLVTLALNPLGMKHYVYQPHMDVPRAFSALTELVGDVASALEDVCKNAFSYAIWRKSVLDFESKSYLREFSKFYRPEDIGLVSKATPLLGVSAQRDLIEFALILRRQAVSASPPEGLEDVMKIKRALLDMIEYQRDQKRYGPTDNLLDLLEFGYELFPEGVPSRDFSDEELAQAKVFYQFNYGAASLLDIALCFPTATELRVFLIKQYPNVFPTEVAENALNALEGVDLQATLPSFLREAKAEIDTCNAKSEYSREANWLFGAMLPFDNPRSSPLFTDRPKDK